MSGRGINKVILLCVAGADPEVRYTANGAAICTARAATNESWNDKQSGQRQERTEWHRLKFFGKLAEVAGEYIKKGKQIYVEGSLRTEKYTDKEGVERFSTEIIVSELQLLGGGDRQNGEGSSRASDGGGQREGRGAPQQSYRPHNSNASRAPARNQQREPVAAGGLEDDEIPFDRAGRGPR